MILKTERLLLRPSETGDAQAIFDAYASDPEATKYLVFATLTDVRQAAEYLERTVREREEGTSITWVIVIPDTQRVIGAIDIQMDGNIGYAIGRLWWGNGYVPEAENARSARVFEKLGFRSLGVKDRAIVHPAFGQEPRPALLFERDL